MRLKSLKEVRDATPFQPFDVHLSDGRAIPVITADHLFFVPNSEEFIIVPPDGGVHILDLCQVTSIPRKPKARKQAA
jgi:hypothetical protein